jgi:hypothetical protein
MLTCSVLVTLYLVCIGKFLTPRWSTYWSAKLNLPPNPTIPANRSTARLNLAHLVHAAKP